MSISKHIPAILDRRRPVDPAALEDALHSVMLGEVDPAACAGFLVALASRPIEAATIAAGARVMRSHRVAVPTVSRPIVDTCGTGGDASGSFNISTATAFVLAAGGVAVAKHGNRSVSSKVGSADVLEAAGCELELSAEEASRLLDATGFAFLYARSFHPAMRHVAPVRKSLAMRTIFNVLGPLTNPALADRQLLGVYDPELTEPVASALGMLGVEDALVVHCAGLDEFGLHAPTRGHRVRGQELETFELAPEDVGLARAPLEALRGGDVHVNLELMRGALAGEGGACADAVALNAGAGLLVAGRVATIAEGVEAARALQASGEALRVLERYATSSARCARTSA